ncbi:MAG: toll/interleukin-1 receptor domain-containing protein [Chloroflexota bacterium]
MPTGQLNHSPKVDANRTVDELISHFSSADNRRRALRRALLDSPDDLRLLRARDELSTPRQVQRSALRGVYINYNRTDEVFAVELALLLRDTGVDVWLDMLDIDEDADWNTQVNAALDRCGLMLAVQSPRAVKDRQLQAERDRFRRSGKLVLTVVAERIEWVDEDGWLRPVDCSRDFDAGCQRLLNLIAPAAVSG